jgi:hypothetical protein
MATTEQIAEYVRTRLTVGRVHPGADYRFVHHFPDHGTPLPTVEQIAADLVKDAGFRALQLGRFFKTPTGQVVTEAVELVIPRALSPEFALIVDALALGAAIQQEGVRSTAVLLTLGGILVGGVMWGKGKAA